MKKSTVVAVLCLLSIPVQAAESPETIEVSALPSDISGSGSDVYVTLTRSAYPVSNLPTYADTVPAEKIKVLNAQNAGQAVAQQTSILVRPYTQQLGSSLNASIRGSNVDQTLVLIDGRPMEGVALGTPDLAEIPAEQIDHIEILRGGASALYGPNAMGGVINVITKKAAFSEKPVTNLGFEAGSFDRQLYRADFNYHAGPLNYFLFAKQGWESGFRDNSDARFYNVGGNGSVSMGAAGKLMLDGASYHNNFGVPGLACGPSDPFCFNGLALEPNQFNNKDEKLAGSPTARQITDSRYLRTAYILPLPADTVLDARLFGSEREVLFNDANNPNTFLASHSDRNEQSHGAEMQVNLPLGFMVGGSFIHDREDNSNLLVPANSFDQFIENYGVFAQLEFRWKSLTLIPSGRYDHNSHSGESKSPRVQLIEDATPWLRLSGSAGRSFHAPTLDQLYFKDPFFIGNPDLKPETAWTYDAGFELHNDSISFRAAYFRSNISDLIQVVSSDPADVTAPFFSANVSSARRQGAEVELHHVWNEMVKDSWNWTYLDNVGKPAGFDELVALPFSPRHTVNYVLSLLPLQGLRFDNTARYQDTRYSGNNQTGTRMPSQLIWDLRLAFQWRVSEFFFGINNLTDKRYQEQPGFPLPGRTYYGGINVKL